MERLAELEAKIETLEERLRSVESSGGAFTLFENNIVLQNKVRQRTAEIEKAN